MNFSLTPVFMYPAHMSCVKCVALSSGRFLATGSTDEQVKLYDLRARKEVGMLMHHQGSTTHLQFYQGTHLMTSAEDGSISIFRTRDWELLKSLTGHKGAVNWFDVHSSGKVMLSVGKDGTVKCWDLTKGLCVYSMKLSRVAERACWTATGSKYVLLMDRIVQIYDISEQGHLVGKFESKSRINSIVTTSSPTDPNIDLIFAGGEDKTLSIWKTDGVCLIKWKTTHSSRIKDIAVIPACDELPLLLVSCDSEGKVFVWNVSDILKKSGEESTVDVVDDVVHVCEFDAKCRLTCLQAISTIPPKDETKKSHKSDKVTIEEDIKKDEEITDEEVYEEVIMEVKSKPKTKFQNPRKPIESKKVKETKIKPENSHQKKSEVTENEIKNLKNEFEKVADAEHTVTKDQFKQTLVNHVQSWSAGAQYLFLERLFDAFDLDGNQKIDFREFIQGLSVFLKGTPEEKMECVFF
ncbi:hypothetical protein HK096_009506 [Nowakowskiella sp. JEL0078]|nr:hypothetical protein HK096_009506 [Nowakowskiella sp. JEL0078]